MILLLLNLNNIKKIYFISYLQGNQIKSLAKSFGNITALNDLYFLFLLFYKYKYI